MFLFSSLDNGVPNRTTQDSTVHHIYLITIRKIRNICFSLCCIDITTFLDNKKNMYTFQINKKLLGMKIHFFLASASAAPIIPFLPMILMQRGYSSVVVGSIFTLLPLPALFLRAAVGAITDKYKCRKPALIFFLVIISLVLCLLMFIPGTNVETQIDDVDVIKLPTFWLFIGSITILYAGIIARGVLENTICMGLLGENKYKFGEQRVWGAVGWGMISAVSGAVIDWFSKGQNYKNYTPGMIISLVICILNIFVASKIEVVENTDKKFELSDVKKCLNKKVLSFLLWVVAFGFFNAFIWYYFFWYLEDIAKIYHPEMIPYIKTLEGFSLTIQCLGGEVPFFFLSSYILKRVNHMTVFSLMFLGFAARFFLYSIITNPVYVLPVEIFNGPTYALAYSAATSYAAVLAPVGTEGTLQGIVGTAFVEIGAPFGSFVGGYMFDRLGSIASFKYLAGIALVVCFTQTFVNWLINRYSKDKDLKENTSSTDNPAIVGIGIGAAPIYPFLSTISKQRGYSSIIIGLIFTIIPFLGLVVRPAVGAITDKYKCRKSTFILSIGIMSIFISILMLIPGSAVQTEINDADVISSPLFWWFFGTIAIFKISIVISTVMEDTICVHLLDDDKTKYGHQKMWGAIGWGIMSVVFGMSVDWFSKGLEYTNYTPGFIISLICSFLDMYVVSKMKNAQNKEIKTGLSNVRKVFTKIKVLSFLFWVVAYGILLSFIWHFQFLYMEDISNIYHPETKPYIKTIQGLSLTIQCIGGEVPFFILSNFILNRVSHMNVFSLLFLTFAVRFFLYSIISNPVWVLPVELLNGITYALGYSTAISYAAELAPVGAEGTLQGIVGTALEGIGIPIGSFIGGTLFNRFGSITSFRIFSYVALAVTKIIDYFNFLFYIKTSIFFSVVLSALGVAIK
ncbi:hypothetical protein ACI65C_003486 [Semiaphis heraclei]